MYSIEHDEEVTGDANFLIALAKKYRVNNSTPLLSNELKADTNASFPTPLTALLTTDMSHPETATH